MKLTRVTAWVLRFISACKKSLNQCSSGPLTTMEVVKAEGYWLSVAQRDSFGEEVEHLERLSALPPKSKLKTLHPFSIQTEFYESQVDCRSLSWLTLLCIQPSLLGAILSRELLSAPNISGCCTQDPLSSALFSVVSTIIIRARSSICYVTRSCVTCLRYSEKPKAQQMGQLPLES